MKRYQVGVLIVLLVALSACDRNQIPADLEAQKTHPPLLQYCDGKIATIVGTFADDVIFGTGGDDVIVALAGNDIVYTLGGNDTVCAGDGDDILHLGLGHDVAFGEAGNDTIDGGPGNDSIHGQLGSDTLSCGSGASDYADGGRGQDNFVGDVNTCDSYDRIGFAVHAAPLDAAAQYSVIFDGDTLARSYVVAGCIPLNMPNLDGVFDSNWIACNDLEFVEDGVEESPFVSCTDMFPNGVLRSVSISEYRNRKWDYVTFSCSPMNHLGQLGSAEQSSSRLFDFSKSGTVYTTRVADDNLPTAFLEYGNGLELTSNRLLAFQLITDQVNATTGELDYVSNVTERIPDASPFLLNLDTWTCPENMVLTGLAVGHIPANNGNYTRPVYFLGECRKLLRE
jgi:hypothetical protein